MTNRAFDAFARESPSSFGRRLIELADKHRDVIARAAMGVPIQARDARTHFFKTTVAFAQSIARVTSVFGNLAKRLREELRLSGGTFRSAHNPGSTSISEVPTALRAARTARRVATAATPISPRMIAGGTVGALASPFTFATTPLNLGARPSGIQYGLPPIAINYSPNVAIHAQEDGDGNDDHGLARLVMDVLERHGRELHQVLQRELIRRQRTEF